MIPRDQLEQLASNMYLRGLIPADSQAAIVSLLEEFCLELETAPKALSSEAKQDLAMLELLTGMQPDSFRAWCRELTAAGHTLPIMLVIGVGTPVVRKLRQAVDNMARKAQSSSPAGLVVAR